MAQLYKVMTTDTDHIMVESEIPIVVALLPPSQKNQRPGYWMDPIGITEHENSNPKSNAAAELRYFRNGAEGRQASYHFVGDESVIYQMIPISENAWHASDSNGNGNRRTIALSIAQGAKSFTTARKGMAFFAGKLLKALNLAHDKVWQHYDWAPNRKNCPEWIRNNKLWPEYMADVKTAYYAGGQTPVEPTYASKIVLATLQVEGPIAPAQMVLPDGTVCVWVGDRVRATQNTPRYQWAGTKAPRIGPDINKGEEFDVDWLFENGEGWWYYTPHDTRVFAAHTERISDAKAA